MICKVGDPLQSCFHLHPDGSHHEKASEASLLIQEKLVELNASPFLTNVTQYVIDHKDQLSEEEYSVSVDLLQAFVSDRLSSSVHGETYKELQNRNNELSALIRDSKSGRIRNRVDILETLDQLIQTRQELAEVVSFDSYSDMMSWNRDLKSPKEVFELLDEVKGYLDPLVQQELQTLKKMPNYNKLLKSGDIHYITQYATDSIQGNLTDHLSPYFSLENALDGIIMITKQSLGVDVVFDKEATSPEIWHPDVVKANLFDNDEYLGTVYLDLYEREYKFTGSSTFPLRLRSDNALPSVILSLSLTRRKRSSYGMSYHDVNSLFHEWGHVLQALLCKNKLQHFSGTRGHIDFVETPSTFFENFLNDYRVTKLWAHDRNGIVIPEQPFIGVTKKRPFAAIEAAYSVSLSAVDQKLHSGRISSLDDAVKEMYERYFRLPTLDKADWLRHFDHLLNYGASYYSYTRCQSLSSHIWHKLFLDDPLSPSAGLKYRNEFLQYGGYRETNTLIKDMLGEDVTTKYFIDRITK